MRIFKQFPNGSKCRICNTNKKGECVLIGVNGTQEGYNIEALPFHLDCIELFYYPDSQIIGMKVRDMVE